MQKLFSIKTFLNLLTLCTCYQLANLKEYEFSENTQDLSTEDLEYLKTTSAEEWDLFIQLGVDSVDKQRSLEENLLNSDITVQNGSISHAQLLDSLPNSEAWQDNEIALKILKASLYFYNTKCASRGISGEKCSDFLEDVPLPPSNTLQKKCMAILHGQRDGHHSFRRLLSRNYKDGLYEMHTDDKLPSPRVISSKVFNGQNSVANKELLDEKQRNLVLVQWTQFIEHDLSKPVVMTMGNGRPIQCCATDNQKLLPRHQHPACAPLLGRDAHNKYGRETCLNYVRSAVAVGSDCNFGAAEQLNQATGYLDLSQLYGFTTESKKRMRTFKDGQIKCTPGTSTKNELLPMAEKDITSFCALSKISNDSNCFMAGDTRVNSNPLTIVAYTIFLRNHNYLATKLKTLHADWDDNKLFEMAKALNVDIYRRIVFDEWLPMVLGYSVAEDIKKSIFTSLKRKSDNARTSNEFAVAAIRFSYSMLPNTVRDLSASEEENVVVSSFEKSNINDLPTTTLFVLKDEIFKTHLVYTSKKIDDIMDSLLRQRAMRMDPYYVESLISDNANGSTSSLRNDALAFDIQRGRDHGLQGYVKYMEICNDIKVNNWRDLEAFIHPADVSKLKSVYNNVGDIDLIIGGIAEIPRNNSTVGPTFTCILAEQFLRLLQWQSEIDENKLELINVKKIKASDLLCLNSELEYVPTNAFQVASEKNPLKSCDMRLKALGL